MRENYYDFSILNTEVRATLKSVLNGIRSVKTYGTNVYYIVDVDSGRIVYATHHALRYLDEYGQAMGEQGLYLSAMSSPLAKRIAVCDALCLPFALDFMHSQRRDPLHCTLVYSAICTRDLKLAMQQDLVIRPIYVETSARRRGKRVRLLLYRLYPSSHYAHATNVRIFYDEDKSYYRIDDEGQWVRREKLHLTEREKLLVQLSSQGYMEKELAEATGLSLARLKSAKSELLKKMKVRNMKQAIMRCQLYDMIAI